MTIAGTVAFPFGEHLPTTETTINGFLFGVCVCLQCVVVAIIGLGPSRKGDVLKTFPPAAPAATLAKRSLHGLPTGPDEPNVIRVVLGPQDFMFTAKGVETFLTTEWRLSPVQHSSRALRQMRKYRKAVAGCECGRREACSAGCGRSPAAFPFTW